MASRRPKSEQVKGSLKEFGITDPAPLLWKLGAIPSTKLSTINKAQIACPEGHLPITREAKHLMPVGAASATSFQDP